MIHRDLKNLSCNSYNHKSDHIPGLLDAEGVQELLTWPIELVALFSFVDALIISETKLLLEYPAVEAKVSWTLQEIRVNQNLLVSGEDAELLQIRETQDCAKHQRVDLHAQWAEARTLQFAKVGLVIMDGEFL